MGTPSFRFVALSINFSTDHRLLSDIDCSTIRWTMLLMAFQIDWNMIPETFLLALSFSSRTQRRLDPTIAGFRFSRAACLGIKTV